MRCAAVRRLVAAPRTTWVRPGSLVRVLNMRGTSFYIGYSDVLESDMDFLHELDDFGDYDEYNLLYKYLQEIMPDDKIIKREIGLYTTA